ncbi:Prenylcysteine lyase-domain-containing protein [Lipomyces arxii]|uniref:Prenylcysteine lyase-domain-containing protein n=1 Tax=Lipomyces arxii TaxID=56418 RepID=UPI0034CF8732
MICNLNALFVWLYAISGAISIVKAQTQQVFQVDSKPVAPLSTKERIAIIGAGAGGASAAYYLQRYSDNAYDITVFEKNKYIGGRSTTVNVHDDPSWPVELGASIFVKENLNLMAAAKDLGLTVRSSELGRVKKQDDISVEDSFGIWDGKSFVFSASSESSWKSIAKMLYQYGTAPIKARRLAKQTLGSFLKYYEESNFPFQNLTEISNRYGLVNLTDETAYNYFTEKGISELFVDQIVQAATRVNYAQNVKKVQALEAVVCLAADEGLNVEGGNWRIFDAMLQKSSATVRLQTTVTEILRSSSDAGKWELRVNDAEDAEVFDQIIIASPYHQTGIGGSLFNIPEVPYMTLYVTLFTSTKRLSPTYFGLPNSATVPTMLLTTLPADEEKGSHMPPIFNSISIIRYIPETKEYVYKIFSPSKITPSFLQLIFLPGAEFGWVYEKTWKPYPKLDPVAKFTDWKLDEDGIWYLNGIEQFISTMETASLAGANVAAMIVGSNNNTVISVP